MKQSAILLISLWGVFFTLSATVTSARAGENSSGNTLADLSLEDLMKVSVASFKPTTVHESPGIVTALTREEILNSGARDLVDVLNLVPGFQFAGDYYSTVSVGFRGLWGLEGKVLLMLDGLPLNDQYYNDATAFGNRLPMSLIDRVEVIRGPGSAIYGNQAEYAVVNIITQTGSQISGAKTTVEYGRFGDGLARENLTLAYGQHFGSRPEDMDISLQGYLGRSFASDQDRVNPNYTVSHLLDSTRTQPEHLNLGVSYQGLSGRLVIDRVNQYFQDALQDGFAYATLAQFYNYLFTSKYDWHLSSALKLSPSYTFSHSLSYRITDVSAYKLSGEAISSYDLFDTWVDRHKLSLPLTYDIQDNLGLLVGVEEYIDIGRAGALSTYYPDPHQSAYTANQVVYHDLSLFGEMDWKSDYGKWTAGGRFENHSTLGNSFVPRLAYTKSFDPWHFKLLYSRAFRFPSVGNMSAAASAGFALSPERTRVWETEVGYQLDARNSITFNVFDTSVESPIVYLAAANSYTNFGQTGSRGFDLEFKNGGAWGYSKLSYSYYTSRAINTVPTFAVEQDPSQLAGFAPHKLTWNAALQLMPNLRLSPTLTYLSKRYSFGGTPNPDTGALSPQEMSPVFLTHLFVSHTGLFLKNLELGVGVYNLTNAQFAYPMSYDSGRNPLPGQNREYLARVSLNYPL